MTNQQILEKAISLAIKDGWVIGDVRFSGDMTVENVYYWFDDDHGDLSVNDLIWRHDFAKALFGTDSTCEWCGANDKENEPHDPYCEQTGWKDAWQFHLQQIVIADDPIKYLGDHLNG